MDALKQVQISSYNLFNYLLSGIIFVILANKIVPDFLPQNQSIINFFVYYFIGFSIHSFGSLVVKPLFKKMSLVEITDYKKYLEAIKLNPRIEILSEISSIYRTFCALFSLLFLLEFYEIIKKCFLQLNISFEINLLMISLLVIFSISYIKESKRITKAINSITTAK